MGGKSKRRNAALNRRAKKSGLPPGALVHIGEKCEQAVLITYMDYDERSFQEKQGAAVEECFAFKDTQTVTWINIAGIDDIPMIATIFIPLTFVAGVYGMNFKNMPEIEWRWGYPAVLLLMPAVAGVMVQYFRRRKWL
ncbi:MAG TPA: CorA family divalent cation transporter [Sedimentisphaerales bacterium]|nr:CorA family divalent cation transporter [Sedimentisphaerales bacterium]